MSYLFLFCVVLIPTLVGFKIAQGRHKVILPAALIFAGCLFILILIIINESVPFTGAFDDLYYYKASRKEFHQSADWFDFSQFRSTHDQAGYPMILSWVHQIAGGSLFHRKALNICVFLMLANLWYLIGNVFGGKKYALVFGLVTLCATPLWYYWMFLLKDMSIVFLQSLFVLGLVCIASNQKNRLGVILIFTSTFLVIPFRTPLVFLNLSVLASVLLFGKIFYLKNPFISLTFKILLVICISLPFLYIGSNLNTLSKLGVTGENRTIELSTAQKNVDMVGVLKYADHKYVLRFPIIFLMGEVNAFNPEFWKNYDALGLRPIGMLPWIIVGLPFFLVAVAKILGRNSFSQPSQLEPSGNEIEGLPTISPRAHHKEFKECLIAMLIFILAYAGYSFLTTDTTRWRLASIPPMFALSSWCYHNLSGKARLNILLSWVIALTTLSTIYYFVIKA